MEAQALAYLLKPVDPEKLASVVDRAVRICAYEELREQETERVPVATAKVEPAPAVLHQIVGRKRDRIVLLAPKDIVFFAVEASIVKARTANDLFTVNHSMADLEAGLESHNFFRARRSGLVNLNAIREIRPYFKSSFLLKMADEPSSEIRSANARPRCFASGFPGYRT